MSWAYQITVGMSLLVDIPFLVFFGADYHIVSTAAWSTVCCGESIFSPRWGNGMNTSWKLSQLYPVLNTSWKLSHICVCGNFLANAVPAVALSLTSVHSKLSKILSHVPYLWLRACRRLAISYQTVPYREWFLVIATSVGRPELSASFVFLRLQRHPVSDFFTIDVDVAETQ